MNGMGCCGQPLEGFGAAFYSGGRQVPQYGTGVPRPPWPERPGLRGYGAAAAPTHVYPAWTNAGLLERVGMTPDHAIVGARVVHVGGVGASIYHGYKRNHSVGWAIGWGLLATIFPVTTTAIAVAQGFGKPAR